MFVPIGLISGVAGQLFKQFAVTISVAMLISAINALTLSPALCALFLRHEGPKRGPIKYVLRAIDKLFEDSENEQTASAKSRRTSKPSQQSGANRAQLVEAYGRALEESQKHSVLVQEQIRLQQERVPNEDGKQSQRQETLRDWPLESLAQFEARLVSAYLNAADSELGIDQ